MIFSIKTIIIWIFKNLSMLYELKAFKFSKRIRHIVVKAENPFEVVSRFNERSRSHTKIIAPCRQRRFFLFLGKKQKVHRSNRLFFTSTLCSVFISNQRRRTVSYCTARVFKWMNMSHRWNEKKIFALFQINFHFLLKCSTLRRPFVNVLLFIYSLILSLYVNVYEVWAWIGALHVLGFQWICTAFCTESVQSIWIAPAFTLKIGIELKQLRFLCKQKTHVHPHGVERSE